MDDGVVEQTEVRQETPKAVDVAALKEKHRAMKELPHLTTTVLTENFTGRPVGQERVLVSTIVATPKLDDWSHEYSGNWREGELSSVEAMAVALSEDPERFWQENQHPVKLTKVNGPKGPLYAVEDGSHRVAAAKLSEALEIPAEVEDLTDKKEFTAEEITGSEGMVSSDEVTRSWWEALIYRGAIKGRIEKRESSYRLLLEETPELPWLVRTRRHFVEINNIYQQVYGEEAFTEVKSVPQEILFKNGQAMVWENKAIQEMRGKEQQRQT